jgi:cystathionine gamma-synthase
MLFPSCRTARRCVDFMHSRESSVPQGQIRVIDLVLDRSRADSETLKKVSPSISAVIFLKELFPIAKQYWQHSGDGVSSRRAEFCHALFQEGILVEQTALQPIANSFQKPCKGPRRYQRSSIDNTSSKLQHPESPVSPETRERQISDSSADHRIFDGRGGLDRDS